MAAMPHSPPSPQSPQSPQSPPPPPPALLPRGDPGGGGIAEDEIIAALRMIADVEKNELAERARWAAPPPAYPRAGELLRGAGGGSPDAASFFDTMRARALPERSASGYSGVDLGLLSDSDQPPERPAPPPPPVELPPGASSPGRSLPTRSASDAAVLDAGVRARGVTVTEAMANRRRAPTITARDFRRQRAETITEGSRYNMGYASAAAATRTARAPTITLSSPQVKQMYERYQARN